MFWAPPVPQDLYFPVGLLFTLIGIFSLAWLVFYLENSRDLPPTDRYIGVAFRMIIMAFFLGFGIFWLTLIEII
ncbi:MAG: hypothetical protein ACW981_13005 [Candidatus Hodarchaeales archaeon]|jgi:hypothetical protein